MRILRHIFVALLAVQAALLEAHFGLGHGAGPMAVVLIEGFDHISASTQATTKGWSANFTSTSAGRFDGSCAAVSSDTLRTKTLPSTYTTLIVGFAFKADSFATGKNFFAIRASTTNTLTLQVDSSNRILVKNSGGTTIATGTTTLTTGAWYYIEVKLFVNTGTPASGTCEVHLNGATEIASTAGNFGSAAVDNFGFARATSATGDNAYFDDVYAVDTTGSAPRNTFLGDTRVETIYPTADGSHTQWTPNSGSTHYTQVDETTADSDTSYVSDATPGHLDTYAFGDIDTGATVYGLQINLFARKDDANTRQIAPVIRQSGTDNVGTTVTLGTTYAVFSQIYNQDPSSADWTPTNVNADEFGVKEIA